MCVCALCEMALAQLLIYNFHGKFIHLAAVVVVSRYKQNKQLAGSVAQLFKLHRGGSSGDNDSERLLSMLHFKLSTFELFIIIVIYYLNCFYDIVG